MQSGLVFAAIFPVLTTILFILGAAGCLFIGRGSGALGRARQFGAAGFALLAFNALLSLVPTFLLIELHASVRSIGIVNLVLSLVQTVTLIAAIIFLVMGVITGPATTAAPRAQPWAPPADPPQ